MKTNHTSAVGPPGNEKRPDTAGTTSGMIKNCSDTTILTVTPTRSNKTVEKHADFSGSRREAVLYGG